MQAELEWQKERLRQRDLTIDRLVPKWLQDELSRPYDAVNEADRAPLLLSILTEFAEQLSLLHPTLPSGLPSRTVDYLLRLAVHPYTTNPEGHPALQRCETPLAKDAKRTKFQVSCI
jgi:hypothetical protein